jgi:hypothetical protein
MPGINLLPKDLLPDPNVLRLSNILRSVATIALAVFILVLIGGGAYYALNAVSLNASLKNQARLKASIEDKQETEQSLILVKDRLAKINDIKSKPSADQEVVRLSTILGGIPAAALLTEAVLGKDATDTTFVVADSTLLSQLLANVVLNTDYKRIDLLSFSFSPTAGYVVSLGFSNK